MSMRQRPNFDEFPRHFHPLFSCNFAHQKISGRKIHVDYIDSTFLNVISLAVISMVFLLTFFDIILMVEKFSLFAHTFFDEISMGKSSMSFLVSCKLMKTFEGFSLS